MPAGERREGARTNLDIRDLSYTGCRLDDLAILSYNLLDLSSNGAQMDVRTGEADDMRPLDKGDVIDLLLSLRSDTPEGASFDRGRIMWAGKADTAAIVSCGIHLENAPDTAWEDAPLWSRLSLSLETSNIILEDPDLGSADEFYHALVDHAISLKKSMAKELERLSALPEFSDDDARDILTMSKTGCLDDIGQLQSRVKPAKAAPDIGPTEVMGLTYEEICAIVKGASKRLDFSLGPYCRDGNEPLHRITSLHRELLADHNALVLLRTGYLAYVYQNSESSL
ncbi:MAG TPA: hypothetical protein VGJ94_12045 [Syntrophorhabdaceae bacterium]|jgi:hypothetical protein